ncbi:MAG: hypothetical protein C0469_12495 [Cyanobacteria bacterium DS2.3.42]|nr:hypothetical protein [Cyanobacteria bacterium DS2.3.42]
MHSNLENLTSSESFKSVPDISFDSLQSFRMPESVPGAAALSGKNEATLLSFEGPNSNGFTLFDSAGETGRAGSQNDDWFDPKGEKGEKAQDEDDEHERGEDDVRWVNELHGANENNAESKDLKESLGRIKPNELAPILNELKNLKHDDAIQFLKEKFNKLAGADNGISPQELANEFEVNKDPKQRAACIYATRYFDSFAQAGNLVTRDWSGPTIETVDLEKVKKPGL